MTRLGPLVLLIGCTPEIPDRYLAIDGREGEYGLTEVEIPELDDPVHMRGDLGDGRVGGYIAGDLFGGTIDGYSGGGPVRVGYRVRDGVGVPFDQDGIVLWSYYNSLAGVRSELADAGVDTEAVFPVPFAFQPSVAGAQLSSNAAYAGDVIHLFILLPDGSGDGIPLAANPGVIRHEFGHALFQSIVAGGVGVASPTTEFTAPAALNEGFADMIGSLALDDPDFITPSFDLGGARDVSGDHTVTGTVDPATDPYSRGTVYASFTWDVRLLTDDPSYTLGHAVRALEDWAAEEAWNAGIEGIDRYPAILAENVIAERPGLTNELCDAFARRFPGVQAPGPC